MPRRFRVEVPAVVYLDVYADSEEAAKLAAIELSAALGETADEPTAVADIEGQGDWDPVQAWIAAHGPDRRPGVELDFYTDPSPDPDLVRVVDETPDDGGAK